MAKENNGKVSPGLILAALGLAAIGVLTFFGKLMQSSDGKPGGAIAWAVALVAILGFFIFMSVKAKGAEDNPDKWKFVEWGCLAAYIIVAVLSASSFNRFFYIISEKDSMQAQARKEVKAIKEMNTAYEHQYKRALTDATEQIHNYIASGQSSRIHDELAYYVEGVGANVESWAAKAEAIVKLPADKELADIASRIEAWNLMSLSSLAADLDEKGSNAMTVINNKIAKYAEENRLIPVIGGGGASPYYLNGYASFDLGEPVESKFASMLRGADGSTALGWIVYVLLNALVILYYLVASRSMHVGPTRGVRTEGLDL